MKTAILSTGSELLRGTILDTNAHWLAMRLFELDTPVERFMTVTDERDAVASAIQALWRHADLIICTGGLGPTTDDITAEAAAQVLGVNIQRNSLAQKQVEARFRQRNFPMAAINLKQADLPVGAEVLENPLGTAPGFSITQNNKTALFLPGVPAEMKHMFDLHVRPLVEHRGGTHETRLVHTFGIGESQLQERVLPLEEAFPMLTFSYRAAFPSITTSILGTNSVAVADAHQQLQAILAPHVFASEDKSLPQVVGEYLIENQLTIATAESCTGGQIGHELTQVPGSSAYFHGGIIAYDNAVKMSQLNVADVLLEAHGAVSEPVVKQMARGVQDKLNTHVAIATSGIAGPGGGSEEKPVGTVHIAIAIKERIFHKKCLFKGYSRTKVKTASTWTALQMVLQQLVEKK